MRWGGYRDKLEAVKSQVGSDGSPSAPALDCSEEGWVVTSASVYLGVKETLAFSSVGDILGLHQDLVTVFV